VIDRHRCIPIFAFLELVLLYVSSFSKVKLASRSTLTAVASERRNAFTLLYHANVSTMFSKIINMTFDKPPFLMIL
jgi:hypothetical protein